MPNNKKSAKTRSNGSPKQAKQNIENVLKTHKKLKLELEKVKKDIRTMIPHSYYP